MSDHEARATRDHQQIRRWAEERGGRPAKARDDREGGVLRIDFQEPDEGLEEISWGEFFEILDSRGLAFLHQERTADGSVSRFNKFVSAEGGEARAAGGAPDETPADARATTDHDAIRRWVEERDGRPAKVRDARQGGILRIDFQQPDAGLQEISWDEFFAIFEDRDLAFLHQDRTADGSVSRFSRFVHR